MAALAALALAACSTPKADFANLPGSAVFDAEEVQKNLRDS